MGQTRNPNENFNYTLNWIKMKYNISQFVGHRWSSAEKCVTLNFPITKREKLQINNSTFHLKNLEEQIITTQAEEGNNKEQKLIK